MKGFKYNISSILHTGRINRLMNLLKLRYTVFMVPFRHKKALKIVRRHKKIKVVFLALNSAAWKFEKLYRLMENDERFEPLVIICPISFHYDDQEMIVLMESTFTYFRSNNYKVLNTWDNKLKSWLNIKKETDPDIVFFTHPWSMTLPQYQIKEFSDHLTCYSPYGFYLSELHRRSYSDYFFAALWKNFLETDIHLDFYKKQSLRSSNGVVAGYPWADMISDPDHKPADPWKKCQRHKKRIIWAPHHTIPEQGNTIDFSSFTVYYDFMLNIAERMNESIQIAFKPHPLLKKKLYKDTSWGREKTDEYFLRWSEMENGQLCMDAYLDLFITSDALILDSISFIAEYLYINKPSIFLMSDKTIEDRLNDFGRMALRHHYHAYNETDILNFIDVVILKGNDIKGTERKKFCDDYMRPPGSLSASENILNDLVKCIFNS